MDGYFPADEETAIDTSKLSSMKILNAIMYVEQLNPFCFYPVSKYHTTRNETLRLQPAVLTSLQRAPAKDSGGKLILGDR